jgi:hypothetical protein
MRAYLLAASLAVMPVQQAMAWGASGHSVVAEIAQRRLERRALHQIKYLLGGEVSLASIASWADDIEAQRSGTVNWHFVNIPYDATSYIPERDCRETPKGDCVINAIERSRATLADRSAPKRQRAEALMFLVHLVGDIHQPLHVADRNDAGGNRVAVTFYGSPMSLHLVWDVGIIERRSYDWGAHVRQIEQDWLPGKNIAALQEGGPVSWALEAHKAAVEVAYDVQEDHELGDAYYQRSLPIVQRQLGLAGIRLARILNEAFQIRKLPRGRGHRRAARDTTRL